MARYVLLGYALRECGSIHEEVLLARALHCEKIIVVAAMFIGLTGPSFQRMMM